MTNVSPLEQQQLDLADSTAHTFWHWVRFDLVTDVVEEHGCTGIVDVGAGSGMLGHRVSTTHPDLDYLFVESSPRLDALLTERFGTEARLGDSDRITTASVTCMLDVVEHIEHDVEALVELRERMDTGCRLVVTVPAMQWAFSTFDTDLGHYRRYSKKQLRSTLVGAGFSVERCDYLFPELLPIVVKRRLRPSTNTVDMPVLSPWKNRVGHAVSGTTARARKIWPVGTSVVAVAVVP